MLLRARVARWPRWAAAALSAALLLPAAGVALAATTPQSGSSESLAEISARIAAAKTTAASWDAKAEIASERFDSGRIALAAAQRLAEQRQTAAAASASRVALMRARVQAFAAAAYETGGTTDTSFGNELSDPGQFLDRQVLTSQISSTQGAALAGLRAAQSNATTTARAAAQAATARHVVLAALDVDRREVASAQTKALRTVVSLQTQQARLVRLAQIAEAEAAAAAAAAKSAQERAAALQARIAAHRAAMAAQAASASLAKQAAARRAALAQQPTDTAPAIPAATPAVPATLAAAPTAAVASPSAEATPPDAGSTTPVAPPQPAPPAPTGTVGSGSGDTAVATAVSWARQELGKPYQWAAAGPSTFDCSGLTLYIYAKAGIYLPHYSGAQFNVGRHVSRSELLPGDLVFFGSPIHHMGIYVGGGQMIHSPQTGDVVRFAAIDRSDYVGAVRIVG